MRILAVLSESVTLCQIVSALQNLLFNTNQSIPNVRREFILNHEVFFVCAGVDDGDACVLFSQKPVLKWTQIVCDTASVV